MSLWKNLIKAKNYLTGSGVSINISTESSAHLGNELKFIIQLVVEDVEVDINSIELVLENVEIIDVPRNKSNKHKANMIHYESTIKETRKLVSNNLHLAAGEEKSWIVPLKIPNDGYPSYFGEYCQISWLAHVVVVKPGTNYVSKEYEIDILK